jgi:hypothetical protein
VFDSSPGADPHLPEYICGTRGHCFRGAVDQK